MNIPTFSMHSPELSALFQRIRQIFPQPDPPALMRIEPDTTTGNPAPGARAELADPAWLLGRQWQFGELTGDNTGSAVSVDVQSTAYPITAWAPLDDASMADPEQIQWRPWPQGALLNELIGHVPLRLGLRQRAEAGAQLADMLAEAGETGLATHLTNTYPLTLDSDPASPEQEVEGETAEEREQRLTNVAQRDALDPQAKRLLGILIGTAPDGGSVHDAYDTHLVHWLSQSRDTTTAQNILTEWRTWFTGAPDSGGAWSTEHLEYRFALRFGDADNGTVLRGSRFGSAEIHWNDLEWLRDFNPALPADAPSGLPVNTEATMLATPLRYPGMPASRYWEMEEGLIDLAALEAQPTDLSRLALAEFAMTAGDDWLSIPVDGLLGAINTVKSVHITDSFGETTTVEKNTDNKFKMFHVADHRGYPLQGIVLPPVSAGTATGEAIEEILFLRDEMANLVWAIEQTVRGRSGDPRHRAAEPRPQQPTWPESLNADELLYHLQTLVPPEWIPLIPYAPRTGQLRLRKGAFLRDGNPLLAASHTLEPTPLDFPDEEIPREGVHLRALPSLARRANGSYARWNAYRVRVGTGSAASSLAWDSAINVSQAGRV